MCYTVVKETVVCQKGHCTAFQVAWRRCRKAIVLRLSGLEPDHFTLCKHQESGCLLPISTPLRIPCRNCGICQITGLVPISIDGLQVDHTIVSARAVIDVAENRLETLRVCRNYIEDDGGNFDHGLDVSDPTLAEELSLQHHNNSVALYNADIVRLESSILEQKQLIRSRIASMATAAREMRRDRAIEQFRSVSASDWKWRYYAYPKNDEMVARPRDYMYQDFLPSQQMLQSCGVGLTGLCNWEVTPLHRMPTGS